MKYSNDWQDWVHSTVSFRFILGLCVDSFFQPSLVNLSPFFSLETSVELISQSSFDSFFPHFVHLTYGMDGNWLRWLREWNKNFIEKMALATWFVCLRRLIKGVLLPLISQKTKRKNKEKRKEQEKSMLNFFLYILKHIYIYIHTRVCVCFLLKNLKWKTVCRSRSSWKG